VPGAQAGESRNRLAMGPAGGSTLGEAQAGAVQVHPLVAEMPCRSLKELLAAQERACACPA